MTNNSDLHFLHHALRMAVRGLGRTWPNPSVGCVLVKDGAVLAANHTADGGRPHAETQAILSAGETARGATAYTTLEPCAHHGKTPPCAQALIDAGITRLVYACEDPDPRVSGKGAQMLRDAGIEVIAIELPEARILNQGFFRRVQHGLPYVAAKIATSLDGMITDPTGQRRWITGDQARAHVHGLRAQFDAIVTGIGTVLADNPQLNVRLSGVAHARFVRVVCDRHLRLPLDSTLVKTARQQPTWVITTTAAVEQAASHATELREAGVVFCVVEDASLAPHTILRSLADQGITRVLLEAGAALTSAFLSARCVDTLYWYRAPMLLANAGATAPTALDNSLQTAAQAALAESIALGPDRCDIYRLDSCLPG